MPHVLLGDLEGREIFPGHVAKLIHTDKMTVAYWDIAAGSAVPTHNHPNEQVVNVLSGKYELTVAGTPHVLEPGAVFVIPSGETHAGRALTDCRLLDVFCPVREDYR